MNWFSKLIGREVSPYEADDDHFTPDMAAPSSASKQALGFPSFRHSAGRLAGPGGLRGVDDARALICDAFTPSQPVKDRAMFAGRRPLLKDLVVAIEDQRLHFVLYGDRGIGKTSILHVLKDLASDADYLVIYISCGDRMTFSDFARRVAQRIPLLYHGDYAPGSREIEENLTLADILPKDSIEVSSLAEQIERLTETRVLMLLDEFDRVEAEGFRQAIAELIKHLSDRAAPAQVVVAGVASNLTDLIAQIPSIRRNVLGVQVPNMSDDEVGEMLGVAEQRAGIVFGAEARELIGLASLGLPYLVGLVGQHAALIATEQGRVEVVKADVRAAVKIARNELASRIDAQTLHAITMAEQNDQLLDYSQLAHVALQAGGLIPAAAVDKLLSEPAKASGEVVSLVEPLEGDQLKRWHFKDDGASPFIWLSALCSE